MGSCEQERGYIHTVMIDFPIQQGIIIIMYQNSPSRYWIDLTRVIRVSNIHKLLYFRSKYSILSIRSLLVGSNEMFRLCQIHHITQQAMWVTHIGLHYTIWTNFQTIPIPKQGRRSQQCVVAIPSSCWWIMQTKSL